MKQIIFVLVVFGYFYARADDKSGCFDIRTSKKPNQIVICTNGTDKSEEDAMKQALDESIRQFKAIDSYKAKSDIKLKNIVCAHLEHGFTCKSVVVYTITKD